MPRFQYVTSVLGYDHVQFTAIVRAPNLDSALADIGEFWPEAEFRSAEIGVDAFGPNDEILQSVKFGVIDRTNRPGLIARIKAWAKTM